MRDIEFRAWDKEQKRYFKVNTYSESQLIDTYGSVHPTFVCDVEQFTTLRDLNGNGKKIYDGDIFNDGGIVVWRAIGWFVEKTLSDGGKGWLRLDEYLNNDETRHVVSTVHE